MEIEKFKSGIIYTLLTTSDDISVIDDLEELSDMVYDLMHSLEQSLNKIEDEIEDQAIAKAERGD